MLGVATSKDLSIMTKAALLPEEVSWAGIKDISLPAVIEQ
jgi:hypothetical protein